MNEGPITQVDAVMFLRARHLTAAGRDRDSEERDIARQRQLCQEAAEMYDALIVGEYIEYGGTGPIRRRPVVQRMLDELQTRPTVRFVITVSHDRLARMPRDFQAVEERITAARALIVVVDHLTASYRCNPNETDWDDPDDR